MNFNSHSLQKKEFNLKINDQGTPGIQTPLIAGRQAQIGLGVVSEAPSSSSQSSGGYINGVSEGR